VDELQFQNPDTGRRFRKLDACIRDLADDSWNTTSYRLLGNFYTSSWCSGPGAREDCQIASGTEHDRDQHAIELYTLFYSQDYPQVFGLGFQALWVPESAGWGASYYFAEQGGSVVGEGWGVTFREYQDAYSPPASTVSLGWKTRYTIFGPNRTEFEYPSELSLREDLAIYLSGAESMRDRGLRQSEALSRKVSEDIKAGKVQTCDPGPYQGDGIPPACPPRPMTDDEKAAEVARTEAYFAEQERLLQENYQEMYTAWMRSFPFKECWPD
jgi:hypothetical protein